MLAVTLDRDLSLGTPAVPARARRFVTDRHGPAATNRAISAAMGGIPVGRDAAHAVQNTGIFAPLCLADTDRSLRLHHLAKSG
jgi:hypothetical protein